MSKHGLITKEIPRNAPLTEEEKNASFHEGRQLWDNAILSGRLQTIIDQRIMPKKEMLVADIRSYRNRISASLKMLRFYPGRVFSFYWSSDFTFEALINEAASDNTDLLHKMFHANRRWWYNSSLPHYIGIYEQNAINNSKEGEDLDYNDLKVNLLACNILLNPNAEMRYIKHLNYLLKHEDTDVKQKQEILAMFNHRAFHKYTASALAIIAGRPDILPYVLTPDNIGEDEIPNRTMITSALHLAATKDNPCYLMTIVKHPAFRKSGLSLTSQDIFGLHPLAYALIYERIDNMSYLLNEKVAPNTPIYLNNYISFINMAATKQPSPDETIKKIIFFLNHAFESLKNYFTGSVERERSLACAEKSSSLALEYYKDFPSVCILEHDVIPSPHYISDNINSYYLIEDGPIRVTPLAIVISTFQNAALKELLRHSPSLQCGPITHTRTNHEIHASYNYFTLAAIRKNENAMEQLLTYRLEVMARLEIKEKQNTLTSAEREELKYVRNALNAADNGQRLPLTEALLRSHSYIARLLLAHGANLEEALYNFKNILNNELKKDSRLPIEFLFDDETVHVIVTGIFQKDLNRYSTIIPAMKNLIDIFNTWFAFSKTNETKQKITTAKNILTYSLTEFILEKGHQFFQHYPILLQPLSTYFATDESLSCIKRLPLPLVKEWIAQQERESNLIVNAITHHNLPLFDYLWENFIKPFPQTLKSLRCWSLCGRTLEEEIYNVNQSEMIARYHQRKNEILFKGNTDPAISLASRAEHDYTPPLTQEQSIVPSNQSIGSESSSWYERLKKAWKPTPNSPLIFK